MVWYEGTPSSGERSGWITGTIVKPRKRQPWAGLVQSRKDLAAGCNYRVEYIINGQKMIESVALDRNTYSAKPLPKRDRRTWVMLRRLA